MTETTDIKDALIDAAMAIATEGGWRQTDIGAIAARADIQEAEAKRQFRDKRALLIGLSTKIDAAVAEALDEDVRDDSLPVRDRLFEVLMARFDSMSVYRDGIRGVLRALPSQPVSALCGLPTLARSMSADLRAVGLSVSGPCGRLRVKGLGAVFLTAMRVWLGDDSADMAATMKELDRRLKDVESLALAFSRSRMRDEGGRGEAAA